MTKTIFNYICDDWKRVKNHSRTTVGKEFTENEATDNFKLSMLIAEHSPIRLIEFDWSWKDIPYWVSTEWSRHKFEKFIKSQRNDRQGDYDRNSARQDAPVNFDGYANMQNLIDVWQKRLCRQATDKARELAEDFKIELSKTHKAESDVLVPTCIRRAGCPEIKCCGYWQMFVLWCKAKGVPTEDLLDIKKRYALYNEYFKN